jgi:hypothetical protein
MPERQVITSLTGTVAPLLTIDTNNATELDQASFHLPREWKKSSPFVTDDVSIQPTGQSGLNLELNFELPKLATQVVDMILQVDLPPYTVAPLGAQASYVDWLGFALIDYFRTNFGSNQNFSTEAYDLYFHMRKSLNLERLDAVQRMVYGDTTTAQRSALLLNGTTTGSPLLVPLWQPFSRDPMNALPLVTLSQKTRFVLKTQPLQNLVNLAAGATVATLGQVGLTLLLTVAHTSGNEAAKLLELSRDDDGIAYMIHQHVRQNGDDFSSTQTGFVINCKLAGLTKPLKQFTWALIPTKLINNTGRNDMFFFNPQPPAPIPAGMTPYSPIVNWNVDANGQIIQRTVIRDYTRLYKYMEYQDGFAGEDVFTQQYARFQHAVNAATGYLDYTNLNNPTLRITLGVGGTGTDPDVPANPQSLRVVINAEDYNFWFFKSGNWSRTFN